MRNIVFIVNLLLLTLMLYILFIFKREVTNPIEKLIKASQKIAKGDFQQIIDVNTKDEIGVLAKFFNSMKNDLKDIINKYKLSEIELKEGKDKYYKIFEHTGAATFTIGEDGIILLCNNKVEKLCGFSKEEIEGRKKWTEFVCKEDLERMKTYHFNRRNNNKSAPEEYEFNLIDRNKNIKNISIQITTFDKSKYSIVSLIDITEKVNAENKLKNFKENLEEIVEQHKKELSDKSKEFERSQLALTYLVEDVNKSREELEKVNRKLLSLNQDLESFAYSVSHDLRAPLRAIEGFSEFIQEDYSGVLDEQGKHFFERIKFNINRMSNLIDDLLMLSRVGRREIMPQNINVKTIAFDVFNSLKNSIKDRKIDFVFYDCPNVSADPGLIQILLENLISNSIKFTKLSIKAKIEVGYEIKNKKTIFFIKDNGVGFDMRFANKLFIPFQRLHSDKDFKGTGIGLSIVKRIITKHNGEIWADSTLNKGTVFYFTLNN